MNFVINNFSNKRMIFKLTKLLIQCESPDNSFFLLHFVDNNFSTTCTDRLTLGKKELLDHLDAYHADFTYAQFVGYVYHTDGKIDAPCNILTFKRYTLHHELVNVQFIFNTNSYVVLSKLYIKLFNSE